MAKFYRRSIPYARVLMKGLKHLPTHGGAGYWAKSKVNEGLKLLDEAKDVGDLLHNSRHTYGYDLTLHWSQLDRPCGDFVTLLEQYRRLAVTPAQKL